MTNLKKNLEGFINPNGLYRVWAPLHDDGRAPLVSIWIDPKMAAFEPQALAEPLPVTGMSEEETAEEIEDSILTGRQRAVHWTFCVTGPRQGFQKTTGALLSIGTGCCVGNADKHAYFEGLEVFAYLPALDSALESGLRLNMQELALYFDACIEYLLRSSRRCWSGPPHCSPNHPILRNSHRFSRPISTQTRRVALRE